MKMRGTLPTLLVLVLLTTLATTQSSSATTQHGPSAFGQGFFTFFNGIRSEGWTYSFDVTANKNGQAHGRAIFDISDNFVLTQVVVRIDCLEVISSAGISDAIITGTVLQSDDPSYLKRDTVVFGAEDNSGSATIRPDIISPIFVIPPEFGDCHEIGQPLTMFPQPPDAITITP